MYGSVGSREGREEDKNLMRESKKGKRRMKLREKKEELQTDGDKATEKELYYT